MTHLMRFISRVFHCSYCSSSSFSSSVSMSPISLGPCMADCHQSSRAQATKDIVYTPLESCTEKAHRITGMRGGQQRHGHYTVTDLCSGAGGGLFLGDGVHHDLLGLQLARLQALPLVLQGGRLLRLQRLALLDRVPLGLQALCQLTGIPRL